MNRKSITMTGKITRCSLCGSGGIDDFDAQIRLSRCGNCGYIFVNPMPSKDEIKKYYSQNDNYEWWQENEEGFDQLSQRRLANVLKYKQGGDLLDVGAGIGQFLHFAEKHFSVTGTEVATSAIGVADKKYGIKLMEGEVEEMDLGNQRFDVVTLFHVLEHVHDPDLLLTKCQSLLRKDGVIVIAVPNDVNKFLKRRLKQLLRLCKIGRFQHYGSSGLEGLDLTKDIGEVHLSQFTQKALRKYFKARDYQILAEGLDPYFVGSSLKDRIKYQIFKIVKQLTGANYYDTMLYVVKPAKYSLIS